MTTLKLQKVRCMSPGSAAWQRPLKGPAANGQPRVPCRTTLIRARSGGLRAVISSKWCFVHAKRLWAAVPSGRGQHCGLRPSQTYCRASCLSASCLSACRLQCPSEYTNTLLTKPMLIPACLADVPTNGAPCCCCLVLPGGANTPPA